MDIKIVVAIVVVLLLLAVYMKWVEVPVLSGLIHGESFDRRNLITGGTF